MVLKLYNTLTRATEEVTPLNGKEIRMYTCGPTVYDFVHIGNFRTFVVQDLLRRYIKYTGLPLFHVMNITDVDDKIIHNAMESGLAIEDYTARYTEAFLEDMETLCLEKPEVMPRATEHIDQMVDLILKLREMGHTYESEGSIYYRIRSFPDYGKFSRLDLSEVPVGGRIDADEYAKENPRDFVLWKTRKEGEKYWDTPFGPGRPGWHIECSAMSMKYLGESFDLHIGGVDLIFPHHENEIAQSEATTGKPFVRHWVHSEFLLVNGEKMAKSKKNQYTLRDLLVRGFNPMAVRYLLQSVHHRKQLNFTLEGVEQSQSALTRVNEFLLRLREVPDDFPGDTRLNRRVVRARSDFVSALDDDLNTSGALAALFQLIKEVNVLLERKQVGSDNRDHILGFFRDANRVLAVFDVEERGAEDDQVMVLIREREQARFQRDYQQADKIRADLLRQGVELEDTKEGTRWKKRSVEN